MRQITSGLIVLLCCAFGNVEALRITTVLERQGSYSKSDEDHNVYSQNLFFADPVVSELFNENRNISVIVVGANDGKIGKSNDPMIDALFKSNVRALMVEPNPPVFKRLEENLKTFPKSQRLQPLNVAVCADKSGEVPFYVVSPSLESKCSKAPHWAKYELSSMSYDQVSQHWAVLQDVCGFTEKEDFQAFIDKIPVPCWTPSDLMSKTSFKPQQIDFLLVDAEGFDDKVVTAFMSHLDFEPTLIIYEHKHLAQVDRDNLNALLHKRGYQTRLQDSANTLAVKQSM